MQVQLVFRDVPIDRPQINIGQYSVIGDWQVVSKNQEDLSNAAKLDKLLFITLSILSLSCFHFKGSNSATLSVSDTSVGGCIKNIAISNNRFDHTYHALSGAVQNCVAVASHVINIADIELFSLLCDCCRRLPWHPLQLDPRGS